MKASYDVVVVGGGATGAGVFRDLASRGFKTLLLERSDVVSGTTGRLHGALSSGGRYALKDPVFADACSQENRILTATAPHCFRLTRGLFVTLNSEDDKFREGFAESCREHNIPCTELAGPDVLAMEPNLNPSVIRGFLVPEHEMNIFNLILAVVLTGVRQGGEVRTYHEVTAVNTKGGRVTGVTCFDHKENRERTYSAGFVINAAGPWCGEVAGMAGVRIPIRPTPGVQIIYGRRVVHAVVNRLRQPGDGDVLIPQENTTIHGTTSWAVSDPDIVTIPRSHIDAMIREAVALVPKLEGARVIRTYTGVRPLIDEGVSEREITRMFKTVDHGSTGGPDGFISIFGGNGGTHRAMAEEVGDLVCRKLGVDRPCPTRTQMVVGSEGKTDVAQLARQTGLLRTVVERSAYRFGDTSPKFLAVRSDDPHNAETICTCEGTTRGEIIFAAKNYWVEEMNDLRRRSRVGMGSCQGGTCGFRAAGVLAEAHHAPIRDIHADLLNFLWMRWGGVRPILWDNQLRQQMLTDAVYAMVGNYDHLRLLHPKKLGPRFSKPGEGVVYVDK